MKCREFLSMWMLFGLLVAAQGRAASVSHANQGGGAAGNMESGAGGSPAGTSNSGVVGIDVGIDIAAQAEGNVANGNNKEPGPGADQEESIAEAVIKAGLAAAGGGQVGENPLEPDGTIEIQIAGTAGIFVNDSTISFSFEPPTLDLEGFLKIALAAGRKFQRIAGREVSEQAFLEQFGYLIPERNHHSKKAMRNALRMLQGFAGINATGEMDNATTMLMESSRCGDEDMLGSSRMGNMNILETTGLSRFATVVEEVVEKVLDDIGSSAADAVEIIQYANSMVSYNADRMKMSDHRMRRFNIQGGKWDKNDLTYHFENFSPDLTEAEIRAGVRRAFDVWAEVTPLTFTETQDPAADIIIKFARDVHGDGDFAAFDGPGGTLAHAFFPDNGDVHFDDDETYSLGDPQSTNTDIFIVAVHEIGHSLGLEHSSDTGAIMYPWYLGYQEDYKLSQDDIDGIQQIYGKAPVSRQDVEIDLAPVDRPNPNLPVACNTTWDAATYYGPDGVTYAFKDRYIFAIDDEGVMDGYPKKTYFVFRKAPSRVHAVLSVNNRVYLLRGRKVWLYINKELAPGFPRYIPAGQPSGPNAAFRWSGNGKVYLFKGHRFYEMEEDLRLGLRPVGSPQTIRRQWDGVPVKPDAAFQWKNGKTYFFQGDDYWRFDDGWMKVATGYPLSRPKHWLGCEE